MKLPELLAPVSSIDALKIAVNAGADSIYLSGHKYGARAYAENFSKGELIEAVEYAHLRNVKVYVTVNTLIMDEEMEAVLSYLVFLYSIGVDAVLIQDIGLANLSRRIIPGLDIHASTQMTIHNLDNLKWAKNHGFSRVVLSRELSMEEIQEMVKYANKNNIELEIFSHGALCYSYSGRCYMSSLIGARSGNRGMCAQPCRKKYELDIYNTEEKKIINNHPLMEGYLLSPKDLYAYTQLDELVKLGISTIKIEGRMRSLEYLAITINTYRKALDEIKSLNKATPKQWKPKNKDIENLKLGFNRGFTKGNLFSKNNEEMMSQEKPGHFGLLMGTVTSYDTERSAAVIHIKSDTFPEKNDGIFIVDERLENGGIGFKLDKEPEIVKKTLFLKTKKISYGSEVYITKSNRLTDLVKDLNNEKIQYLKKSNLSFNFKLDSNNYPVLGTELELIDENKLNKNLIIKSSVKGSQAWEKAINRPLSSKQIRKQLSKIDNLPFEIINISLEYGDDLFTPISNLNKLRRKALDDLLKKIYDFYKPSKESFKFVLNNLNEYKELNVLVGEADTSKNNFSELDTKTNSPYNLNIYINNLENLKFISGSDVKYNNVYLELPFYGEKFNQDNIIDFIKEAIETSQNFNLVWKWPDITSDNLLKVLKSSLNSLIKDNIVIDIMVGSLGIFEYLDNIRKEKKLDFNIYGSSKFNIWNYNSFNELGNFKQITLSTEISKKEIETLIVKNKQVLSFTEDLKEKDKFFKFFKFSNNLSKISDIELILQGNMESMESKTDFKFKELSDSNKLNEISLKNDLVLIDEKNRVFPVKTSPEKGIILLNSVEISLINHINDLKGMGLFNFSIDSRWKDSNYIDIVGRAYFEAIHPKNETSINKLKQKVQNVSFGGITTGNFLRGIKKV